MPPKYVKTMREELFYEYAKLISRTVFNGQLNYGFIINTLKEFKSGKKTMSDTVREWQREYEFPKECVFCASTENLQIDHLIPKSRGGSDSADNVVWSCRTCNISRGNKGVFEWLGLKKKDNLHRIVAGKYIKELFELHERTGTLDVSVADLQQLCSRCKNGKTCEEWDTVAELTCFCLESVF